MTEFRLQRAHARITKRIEAGETTVGVGADAEPRKVNRSEIPLEVTIVSDDAWDAMESIWAGAGESAEAIFDGEDHRGSETRSADRQLADANLTFYATKDTSQELVRLLGWQNKGKPTLRIVEKKKENAGQAIFKVKFKGTITDEEASNRRPFITSDLWVDIEANQTTIPTGRKKKASGKQTDLPGVGKWEATTLNPTPEAEQLIAESVQNGTVDVDEETLLHSAAIKAAERANAKGRKTKPRIEPKDVQEAADDHRPAPQANA